MHRNMSGKSLQGPQNDEKTAATALSKPSSEYAALHIGYSSPSCTASFKHPATYGLSPDQGPAVVSCTTNASCIPKGVEPRQIAVTVDSSESQPPVRANVPLLPASIAQLCHPAAQSLPSVRSPTFRPSAAAHAPAASQDSIITVHSSSASIINHSSSTGRRKDAHMPLEPSRHSHGESQHILTVTGAQLARIATSAGHQWYDGHAPQASLLSFDSAVPGRSSNSMSTQLQPRAFSASYPFASQSAAMAAAAGRQQCCSTAAALTIDTRDSRLGDSGLSVDVSQISFRILTSGSGWAAQKGPCSPLTPIPDSPSSPLHWCRCSVQRIRHAGNKNGQFVMVDPASGDTLLACHNTKSCAYDVYLHTTQAGQRYLGALSPNSAQNRFFLLGSLASGQPLDLSPNVDPVQLAISYSKWSGGQQQVLTVMPGLQEDLGDEHQIDAMLDRLAKGHLVPGVQAFRSGAPLSDGAIQEHIHLHGRSVLKSTKNLQLQLDSRLTAWPTFRAGNKVRILSQAGMDPRKTSSLGLGRGSADLLVFKCGRLASEEFSCDFTPHMMTHVQAFCIAVSSITRKRYRYWK